MNPAVTLAFAVVRRLDWIKVPVYWLAQVFGAFIASAIVYGIYRGMADLYVPYIFSLESRENQEGQRIAFNNSYT